MGNYRQLTKEMTKLEISLLCGQADTPIEK